MKSLQESLKKIKATKIEQGFLLMVTLVIFSQEYPTEPLDRKPARQAAITLAGKY